MGSLLPLKNGWETCEQVSQEGEGAIGVKQGPMWEEI